MCLWGIFHSAGSEDVVQLWNSGGVSTGGVMKHHVLQEEEQCWTPGATTGGGQLHQGGEGSRASMAGIDCQEEYRERNMDM